MDDNKFTIMMGLLALGTSALNVWQMLGLEYLRRKYPKRKDDEE